jgi:hypothetical protein
MVVPNGAREDIFLLLEHIRSSGSACHFILVRIIISIVNVTQGLVLHSPLVLQLLLLLLLLRRLLLSAGGGQPVLLLMQLLVHWL